MTSRTAAPLADQSAQSETRLPSQQGATISDPVSSSGAATCADYIPLAMRTPGSAAALAADRAEYLAHRRALRRSFLLGWSALLVVWLVALAAVLAGIDPDSTEGGFAHGLTYLVPLALVVGLPAWYAHLRRRGRIDDFEEAHEADDEDPYAADRFAQPAGLWVFLGAIAVLVVPVVGLAWAWVLAEGGEPWSAVAWTLVVLAVVGLLAVRRLRTGVVATADSLVVTTLVRRRVIPWGEIGSFSVDLIETPLPRGGTSRDLRLTVSAPGRLPKGSGCGLLLGTRAQRARARHNLRVAAEWSRAHGLPIRSDLSAGLQWADGDISVAELMHRAGRSMPF